METIYELSAKAYGRAFATRFTIKPGDRIEDVWQRMTLAYQNLQRQAQYSPERVRASEPADLTDVQVLSVSTT